MIIIGLGTGRSGTASLANLLNSQTDALCFHEMNPSCVKFAGTPRPILNTIDEYQAILDGGDSAMLTVDLSRGVAAKAYDELCKMPHLNLIGDIAFYYLTYVEKIAAHNSNVRFICLKRDRSKTVQSWIRQASLGKWPSKRLGDRISSLIVREAYHESRNFWMEHDGSVWQPDPVWDKCFPKFPGPTMQEAIEQYWDYYYEQSEVLAKKLPNVFRIVETEQINIPEFQSDLLSFCGVAPENQINADAHIHKSKAK